MSGLVKMWMIMIVLVFIVMIPFTFDKIKESKIKVGVTYKYTMSTPNPFEKPYIKYYRVINIKDRYVQYIDSAYNDTSSMSIGLFVIGTEELK